VRPSLAEIARFGALVLAALACPAAGDAADAVRQLTITANLESATALRLSSRVLVFEVGCDGCVAVASVDYVAWRTRLGRSFSLSKPSTAWRPGDAADPRLRAEHRRPKRRSLQCAAGCGALGGRQHAREPLVLNSARPAGDIRPGARGAVTLTTIRYGLKAAPAAARPPEQARFRGLTRR
jgi:hypothetical protein